MRSLWVALPLIALSAALAAARPTIPGGEPGAARSIDRGQAERDFVSANELALKGDLTAAISLYRALLDQGIYHEDLLFNLGNAYAEEGHPIEAIICFERALRLAPNDRDIIANLEIVRKKIAPKPDPRADKALAEGDVVLADLVEPVVAPLPLGVFAWLAIAAEVLLFASLYVRRRAIADRVRRRFGFVAIAALVLLVASSAVVAGHLIVARDRRAVMLETTEVKEGPHPRFKGSGRVAGGIRVRILAEEGGWVRIVRQDGTTGWVPEKALQRI